MLHQERQVVAPLPQGRQVDGKDIQPVIQVRPEFSLSRPRLQVAVCRCDQPHVRADGFVPAHTFECLLLRQAQDLGLKGRRHVANLVQKNRASVALLKLADAAAIGAGECALLMPEQFAFQQLLRDCRAVESKELGVGPRAVLIQRRGRLVLCPFRSLR